MALTDYELKLRARSWCNNLKQNGLITDDITLQNCLGGFPLTETNLNNQQVLQIQPPTIDKPSYQFSIYNNTITDKDSTSVSPADNDRFLIYNSNNNYLTFNDNLYSPNYASVASQVNNNPATFEWTLINRGDDNYTILGSNNKFLSINSNKQIVVSSGVINDFSIWRLGKIDNFVTFESKQYPGNWLSSNNTDVYLAENNYDDAKWLMLNLSTSTSISSTSDIINSDTTNTNSNNIGYIQNTKTTLETQIRTLLNDVLIGKINMETLDQINTTTSNNINNMIDSLITKINAAASNSNTSTDGYIDSSKINTLKEHWNKFKDAKIKEIVKEYNQSVIDYNSAVERLNNKKMEYAKFISSIENSSMELKNKMNLNTQSIEEQMVKSDNLETVNNNLYDQTLRDHHLQDLSLTNSNNYSQLESSTKKILITKVIIITLFIISIIWLSQRAYKLYITNF